MKTPTVTLSVNDPNEPFRHMECEVIDVGHADNVLSVSCREVDEIVRANKELSRLRAANGHLQQELQVLRSREMDIDDVADYAEDRAKLVAENKRLERIATYIAGSPSPIPWDKLQQRYIDEIEALKSDKRELVEALRSVDDLLAYTTARFDLELPAEERFSMKLRAMKTHNAIFATLAKHGEINEQQRGEPVHQEATEAGGTLPADTPP